MTLIQFAINMEPMATGMIRSQSGTVMASVQYITPKALSINMVKGLKIVDEAGAFYGYLKIGYGGATQYSTVLKELYEEFNDHSKVRDAFCD